MDGLRFGGCGVVCASWGLLGCVRCSLRLWAGRGPDKCGRDRKAFAMDGDTAVSLAGGWRSGTRPDEVTPPLSPSPPSLSLSFLNDLSKRVFCVSPGSLGQDESPGPHDATAEPRACGGGER